jgi:hypothetical protein
MAGGIAEKRPRESSMALKRRGPLRPSSATGWLNGVGSPVRRRFGRGAAHVKRVRRSASVQARAGVQATARHRGRAPLACFACQDAVRCHGSKDGCAG